MFASLFQKKFIIFLWKGFVILNVIKYTAKHNTVGIKPNFIDLRTLSIKRYIQILKKGNIL